MINNRLKVTSLDNFSLFQIKAVKDKVYPILLCKIMPLIETVL